MAEVDLRSHDQKSGSAFKQQRMKAWQPILTPKWVIIIFAVCGAVFLTIGVAMVTLDQSVIELEQRYDNQCSNGICRFDIEIPDRMAGPIYIYYKLTNFYQNHRRYVKSRDDKQLRGVDSSLSSCDPLRKAGSKLLYPCGLVASSFFNDDISVFLSADRTGRSKSPLSLTDDMITWPSEQQKFRAPTGTVYSDPSKYTNSVQRLDGQVVQIPDPSDKDLQVWMRTAALPTFRKLYRVHQGDLDPDNILHFEIKDNFNVADFHGTKSIVVSNTSFLGGKHEFLSWAYVVVGILCLVTAAAFAAKQLISPRKPGDLAYWEKNHTD